MADAMISLEELNCCEVEDKVSSNVNSERVNGTNGIGYPSSLYEAEEIGSIYSNSGVIYPNVLRGQTSTLSKYDQKEESFFDHVFSHDQRLDIQTCLEEIKNHRQVQSGTQDVERRKEKHHASFELLKSYGNGLKLLNSGRVVEQSSNTQCTKDVGEEFSASEIMRIVGGRFLHSSSQKVTVDVPFMLENPYKLSFSGVCSKYTEMVQLAELLLFAAEMVGNEQYDRASRFIKERDCFSSSRGHPVERVVYHFSEALQEKIDNKTGGHKWRKKHSFDIDEAMMTANAAILASHQLMPFCQVASFAGIQTIVENVAKAKKIHIIDLAIRNGKQWTILMEALVSQTECPLMLLKITAIGTTSKHLIENTGKRALKLVWNEMIQTG